jgi:hypothetical protein
MVRVAKGACVVMRRLGWILGQPCCVVVDVDLKKVALLNWDAIREKFPKSRHDVHPSSFCASDIRVVL